MIKDFEKYKRIEVLGEGAQGKIIKVQNMENNQYYVLKILFSNDDIKKLVEKILTIKHENIIKYYGYYIKEDCMNIIMEYCDKSDLNKFIIDNSKKNTKINEKIILLISLDICKGIREIHKQNLIHRDLKPENIFINSNGQIKIGDFGVSKQLSDHTQVAYTAKKGTENYYAPERLENKEYPKEVDVWALGCIIYELCTLKKCFKDRIDVYNKTNSKKKYMGKLIQSFKIKICKT